MAAGTANRAPIPPFVLFPSPPAFQARRHWLLLCKRLDCTRSDGFKDTLDYAVRRKLPLLYQQRESQQEGEGLGEAAGEAAVEGP